MSKLYFHSRLLLSLPVLAIQFNTEIKAAQPNVLLVITDDQGIGDFGFINSFVKTPNIDKLASESALLTNFVACPASSPSRVSLYTGRNHLLTGVWGVPPRANALSDEVFMPQYLKLAGYETFLLGKRDCTQSVGSEPWEYGWENGYTVTGYQQKNPRMGTKEGLIPMAGYTSEIMSDEAIKFINQSKNEPWFISLNYITPHMPWICSPEFATPYKAAGYSDRLSSCWGAITQMDAALGRVLDKIKKQGQEENTIILLYSDNGPTSPEVQKLVGKKEQEVPGEDWIIRNALKLRAYKSSTYQNGIRVPFMIKYPKVIQSGVRTQFARVEDILPTLLELTNINSEKLSHQPFSGVSIAANLKDKNQTVKVPDAFRINIAHEGAPRTKKGIIPDPSKLKYEDHHLILENERYVFHNLPGGNQELYNLKVDPGETRNISEKYPDILKKMGEECRHQWDLTIASGRAFIMPALRIGRILWNGEAETKTIVSAGFIQKLQGDATQIVQSAEGFATAGDGAVYNLQIVTPAKYYISAIGENFDKCSPIILVIDNKVFEGKVISPGNVSFGSIDLAKTSKSMTLKSVEGQTEGEKATIRQFVFSTIENLKLPPALKTSKVRKHVNQELD
jgi:arylsulfatase A